jgi:hypothetical protein
VKYNIGDLIFVPCLCFKGYVIDIDKNKISIKDFHYGDILRYNISTVDGLILNEGSQHFSINKV